MRVLAAPALANRAANPYNYLLYSNMTAAVSEYSPARFLSGTFDIFHIHWPEQRLQNRSTLRVLLSCIFLLGALRLLRVRGCKVVWTVHNLSPHESLHPRLEHWFYKHLPPGIDGFLTLSSTAVEPVRERLALPASKPIRFIPHGHYRDIYPDSSVPDSRSLLGLPGEAKVILFFGQVRPYKNVPSLIEAFKNLPGDDYRLIIAGNASDQSGEALLGQIQNDSRISLYCRHIQDKEIQLFFRACDLVVLPFKEILNSGSAILALSLNKPVLVPNLGAMRDLADSSPPGWVQTYDGSLTCAHIEHALESARTKRGQVCNLDHLAWNRIAQETLDFFNTVLDNHQRPTLTTGNANAKPDHTDLPTHTVHSAAPSASTRPAVTHPPTAPRPAPQLNLHTSA